MFCGGIFVWPAWRTIRWEAITFCDGFFISTIGKLGSVTVRATILYDTNIKEGRGYGQLN